MFIFSISLCFSNGGMSLVLSLLSYIAVNTLKVSGGMRSHSSEIKRLLITDLFCLDFKLNDL